MGGFTKQQNPVPQSYANDDSFYTEEGGFDNFGQGSSDDINDELDRLLSNEPEQQDQGGGFQQAAPTNNDAFKAYIEEQRQQREYDKQQRAQQSALDAQARQAQQEQLQKEQLKQQAEAKAKAYRPQFDSIALTDDQKKTYADADPYIRYVVQEMLGNVWDKNLTPALTEQQQHILDIAQRPTQYSLPIEQQVALSRPNVNSIVGEPEFQRYLAEPVEGTGMTRRDLMNFAYSKNNVSSVISMLDAYTEAKGKAKPTRSANPQSGVHSAPQGGGQGGQPRVRAFSELNQAQTKFRQGTITREKLQEIENHFEHLAQMNLIDYNK